MANKTNNYRQRCARSVKDRILKCSISSMVKPNCRDSAKFVTCQLFMFNTAVDWNEKRLQFPYRYRIGLVPRCFEAFNRMHVDTVEIDLWIVLYAKTLPWLQQMCLDHLQTWRKLSCIYLFIKILHVFGSFTYSVFINFRCEGKTEKFCFFLER